jgi:acyl carrier protein
MMAESDEEKLRVLLAEVAGQGVSAVNADEDLVEALGLDSLAGLRLLAMVEKRFGVRFADDRLGNYRTIRQLLDFIGSTNGRGKS